MCYLKHCTKQTYTFLWDGRREQTDDDCTEENDGEQNNAEVKVVDLFDDVRPDVAGLSARRHAVRVLPDKAGQSHH